uniref:Uncharacterized protein n=1 Tax=Rhinolophus ferrumequinum TaxID=59479 RepID=A0A671E313_RHIFE
MLQEPRYTIPQSSRNNLKSCFSTVRLCSRDHLSPFPQRRNKTSCTLNHGYFSSGA